MDGNVKLGFIPARRAIFPAEPARRGRAETIDALKKSGVDVVVPDPALTTLGCVESLDEARATAALFRSEEVQGIVIGAMNFGDEQAAALAVRMAALDVPVLVFGLEEEETLRPATQRRDALCGLLSIGEALRQVGERYSVGVTPVVSPASDAFAADIDWFARVCRVVSGIRGSRFGQVGAACGRGEAETQYGHENGDESDASPGEVWSAAAAVHGSPWSAAGWSSRTMRSRPQSSSRR